MAKMTLEAARVNAKLTRVEVAKALRVSSNTIRRWEKGISYPNIKRIEQLCKLYEIDSYNDLKF